MLTKKQEKKREELRLKMCEHQDIALKFRRQIDAIDDSQKQADRDKIIGRCFALKSDFNEKAGNSGYFRVEYFRKDFSPVGTQIRIFRYKGKAMITLELNHRGFEDWIKNGKQISHVSFNAMLLEAKKMIKLKK